MKKFFMIIVFVVLFPLSICAQTKTQDITKGYEGSSEILNTMIKAIETNNIYLFISKGTDSFKKYAKKEEVSKLNNNIGKRVREYEAEFLGVLRYKENTILEVWKIIPIDGAPDILIRMYLENGKVDGFWVQ